MDTVLFGFCLLLLAALSILSYLFPFLAAIGAARLVIFHLMRLSALYRARPAVSEARAKLALAIDSKGLIAGDTLSGSIGGMSLRIGAAPSTFEWRSRRRTPGSLEITVKLERALPQRLTIISKEIQPLHQCAEIVKTHDPIFDDAISVTGSAAFAAAFLDAGLRRRLIGLSHRAAIHAEHGEITFITHGPILIGIVLAKLIERIASFARDLSAEGPSVPGRLLANAMSEESAEVRYHNLDLLLREYPTANEAKEGLRIAWDAPERGIRYLAAIRRGDEGVPFLLETAEIQSEPTLLRTMVLRHLAQLTANRASSDALLAVLRRSLKDEAPLVVRTAIELLGRLGDKGAIPALKELAARWSTHEETRIRAVDALGSLADRSVEPFLVDVLGGERYEFATLHLKKAAAQALGKIGTRASIRALRRLKDQYRGASDLAEVVNRAIGRIETRCGPLERGQLSIADVGEQSGAVSLSPAAPGAVSQAPSGEIRSGGGAASSSASPSR